ncbi:MAG TPA: nucleotidyltransferase domain-containing protein [Polyangiaceae bacterium]
MREADRPSPQEAATQLHAEKYPLARVLFCAGSVVRGEGCASSDLDVVVLFDRVDNAWRESFHFAGWPVEVFAHDPETLAFFVEQDIQSGRPSLAQMLSEAVVVPRADAWSGAIQCWATRVLSTKPSAPSSESLREDRYWITDLVDDLRDNRSERELRAIACKLYPAVCNFVLKTRGEWLGSGKTLPRLLARAAPELAEELEAAFALFFRTADPASVLVVVERVLAPFGGTYFDGFRSDAPTSSRVPRSRVPWLDEGVHRAPR